MSEILSNTFLNNINCILKQLLSCIKDINHETLEKISKYNTNEILFILINKNIDCLSEEIYSKMKYKTIYDISPIFNKFIIQTLIVMNTSMEDQEKYVLNLHHCITDNECFEFYQNLTKIKYKNILDIKESLSIIDLNKKDKKNITLKLYDNLHDLMKKILVSLSYQYLNNTLFEQLDKSPNFINFAKKILFISISEISEEICNNVFDENKDEFKPILNALIRKIFNLVFTSLKQKKKNNFEIDDFFKNILNHYSKLKLQNLKTLIHKDLIRQLLNYKKSSDINLPTIDDKLFLVDKLLPNNYIVHKKQIMLKSHVMKNVMKKVLTTWLSKSITFIKLAYDLNILDSLLNDIDDTVNVMSSSYAYSILYDTTLDITHQITFNNSYAVNTFTHIIFAQLIEKLKYYTIQKNQTDKKEITVLLRYYLIKNISLLSNVHSKTFIKI